MTASSESRRQVLTYLLLVFAFSSVFYFLILRTGKLGSAGGLYVIGLMWCPGLAAFATLKLKHRSLAQLGWKWPQARYLAMSWYIPLLYAGIAYLIVWTTGLGGFPNHDFLQHFAVGPRVYLSPVVATILYVIVIGILEVVFGMAGALGEEIGWRGFLVPELSKTMGFTATALISGIIWAVWHFPILIWGDYNAGTPAWYSLPCFTIMVVEAAFVFAWIRLKSGSLWTATMLHASHNIYIQEIFTPLTKNTGKTAWFIDEFGAVLPIVLLFFAIYFWRRRGELLQNSIADQTTAAALSPVAANASGGR